MVTSKLLKNVFLVKFQILHCKLNNIRSDFQDEIVRGGSKASELQLTNVFFLNFFLKWPDGLLSPYPKMWFQSGTETGRIGRMLSGIITYITYVFLLGFIITL